MKTFKEFMVIAEGMSMKDFKANRAKLKRREASADAKKRGHVGKEWYNSGRTYSPDEAKRSRAKIDDEERSTRHRSSIDPEGDDSNYSADKTKNPKKLRKQKAMGELGEQYIDEAEGSFGQTPKARKAFGDLANKRRATPASGFSKRGEKTTKVKSAQKHFDRTGNPDAGNRGKKSTKPTFHSGARKGMTQKDRDYSRGEAEYGHTGYDPDFDGGPSGPGGKPKGKKAERQKKTGVSAD